MDKNTLVKNQKNWNFFDKNYKSKLSKLKNCDEYSIFFDTIDTMLEYNCKLEQEIIISYN